MTPERPADARGYAETVCTSETDGAVVAADAVAPTGLGAHYSRRPRVYPQKPDERREPNSVS